MNSSSTEDLNSFLHLYEYITALPVSIAVVSVPMNLIVIVIIVEEIRRCLGRAHQGQIHLIFLAVSDLSVASVYISGGIWRLILPVDQPSQISEVFRYDQCIPEMATFSVGKKPSSPVDDDDDDNRRCRQPLCH